MKKTWRVLHIESSEEFARTVRDALRQAGLNVHYERAAGPGALQAALASGPWDIVLARCFLPELDAAEAFDLIRSGGDDPGLILLDGAVGESALARAFKSGAHDYVRADDLDRLAAVMKECRQQAALRRRKRDEESEFEVSERKYRALFDCASDAIFITDIHGRILDVNKIACVRLGYTKLELLRRTIADIDREEMENVLKERMERIRRTGHAMFERVHTAKNGRRLPVEVNTRVIDFGGEKAILSVARDVTERKQVEQALHESEERLSIAQAAAGMGIYDYDAVSRTIHFDARAREFWGIGPDEPITYRRLFRGIHPADQAIANDALRKAFDPSGGGEYVAEFRVRGRPGVAERWIAAAGRVFFSEDRAFRLVGTFHEVTARRQAEEGLRISEMQLSNAMKMAGLGHWEYDVAADRFTFNDPFYAIFKTTAAKVGGYTMTAKEYSDRFLHPADRELVFLETREAIETSDPTYHHNLEHRIIHEDGSVGYISVRIFIVKDKHGKTIKTYGVNQNITERRRSEEALRESEERLSVARSAAGMGIYDYDAVTGSIHWDARMRELWGLGAETRITYHFLKNSFHPDDRAGALAALRRSIDPRGQGRYDEEFRIKNLADGTEHWISASGQVFFRGGRPWRLVGIVLDITARKRTEEALRDLSLRNQAILSAVPDIIMEVDRDKRYTWANQAGYAFFGDDVIGRPASDYFEGEQETYNAVQPIFSGGKEVVYVESWQRRRDGQKRLLAWWCRGLQDDAGAAIGALSTAHDITERTETEEALQWELAVNSALAELYTPLISPASSIADIAEAVQKRACGLTGSEFGYVLAADPAAGKILGRSWGDSQTSQPVTDQDAVPDGLECGAAGELRRLWGYAVDGREAFFSNAPPLDPVFTNTPQDLVAVERFLLVPVTLGGEAVGQIALANPRRAYTDHDLSAVRRLAEFFALAVQSKRAEEQVKASLKEKVLLLKEIHHRIKNNLQVVMSLLNLQSYHLTDPKAQAVFRENQLRIKSMALIHERLYQSTDLSHVDFKEYITKLAVDLFRAYRIDVDTVRLAVEADDITLGIDASVPCGLIINELLLNSLKHAFPKGRVGSVTVRLERDALDQLRLTVADDGLGLPENIDLYNSKSLGFSLVIALTEQLGGTIHLSREGGTRFEILFRGKD